MNEKHRRNLSQPDSLQPCFRQWRGQTRLMRMRLCAVAVWGLAIGVSFIPAVLAETAKPSQPQHLLQKGDFPPDGSGGGQPVDRSDAGSQFQFKPPSGTGGGQPTGRRSAGSRSSCQGANLTKKESLMAFLPEWEGHALTANGQVELFFYVPYSNISSAKLVLEDENFNEIETIALEVDEAIPGAIAIRPTTQLEAEKTYNWLFTFECRGENEDEPTPFFVEGTVTRVLPSDALVAALESATTDREKAAIYAQNGMWFDALTLLGNLQRSGAENADAWAEFLESVGLGELASKPVR